MDEGTKWAFTQGVLGIWALLTTVAVAYLFRANQILHERLAVKAATDKAVGDASTQRLELLVQTFLEKVSAKPRARRPTVSGND